MKGIIVVDIPEKCENCHRRSFNIHDKLFCTENGGIIKDVCKKPDWCPIKPIPQRKDYEGIEDEQISRI